MYIYIYIYREREREGEKGAVDTQPQGNTEQTA